MRFLFDPKFPQIRSKFSVYIYGHVSSFKNIGSFQLVVDCQFLIVDCDQSYRWVWFASTIVVCYLLLVIEGYIIIISLYKLQKSTCCIPIGCQNYCRELWLAFVLKSIVAKSPTSLVHCGHWGPSRNFWSMLLDAISIEYATIACAFWRR